MADPFSVGAGVAGFLSLGIQVAQSLCDFYSAYRSCTKDIARILLRLESLLEVLRCLHGAVENRVRETDNLLSELDKVAVSCIEIIDELQAKCDKIQKDRVTNVKGQLQYHGSRASYAFRRKTLQALEQEVTSMRGLLSLALDVLQVRHLNVIELELDGLKCLVERFSELQISTQIRKWLNAPDSTTDHTSVRAKYHKNTGLWLLRDSCFIKWISGSNSFLWVKGFAGCGKSVLCGMTIEHISEANQNLDGIGIAFFYFRFDDPAKRHVSGMLCGLLLQLSAQIENGQKSLEQLHDYCGLKQPTSEMLFDLLRLTISKFNASYIFLDGIDEAEPGDRTDLLGMIQKIREWNVPKFHLLVFSRDEYDIWQSFQCRIDQSISMMRNNEHDQDIANFVSYKLVSDPDLQRWHRRHTEIKDALLMKTQGVFKYVELQLADIRKTRIQNQLDECLRSMPSDLDEIYERILNKVEDLYVEDVRRILNALCVSFQQLKMEELIGLLAVNLDRSPFLDYQGRSYQPEDLIEICCGLVEVTPYGNMQAKEVDFVRLAHLSIQTYLESGKIRHYRAQKFAVSTEHAHMELALVCLVYLTNPDLCSPMRTEERISRFPFARYAATKWYCHYGQLTEGKELLDALILELFQNVQAFLSWLNLHDPDDGGLLVRLDEGSLESFGSPIFYSAFLGLNDVLKTLLEAERKTSTAKDFLANPNGSYGNALQAASFKGHERVINILLEEGADPNTSGGEFGFALQAAAYAGHDRVVRVLLENGADVHAQGGDFGCALSAASSQGHEKIVHILLERMKKSDSHPDKCAALFQASSKGFDKVVQLLIEDGTDLNTRREKDPKTALQVALLNGHEQISKILLDRGADVNVQGQKMSALSVASARGQERLVRMLLAKGADANLQIEEVGSALQAASADGRVTIVKILLENGANVNAQGGIYSNALQSACVCGHEEVVHTLVKANADLNTRGGYHGTALQAALAAGHENIAWSLLQKDADVEHQGGKYGSALQAASYGGLKGVISTLLRKGVDINLKSGHFGSALQAASFRGYVEIVQLLLECGADVNAQGGKYFTALQAASYEGQKEVVKVLLEKGADVHGQGGRYGNALQAASYAGHEDVVQILLEYGADVNYQGGPYSSALQAASYGSHKDVVKILLKNGADVNCEGGPYGSCLHAVLCQDFWDAEVVGILIKHGANVNAQAGKYGSVLEMMEMLGDEDLMQILRGSEYRCDS